MTKSQGCAEEDKARESSWSNEVCPELLRGNMADTARRLTSRYNRLWETKRWPKLWKKELVVKIFTKGSLREYNNCRGVKYLCTCH